MKQFSAITQIFLLTSFSFSALSLFVVAPAQSASFMGLGWLPNTSVSYATGVSADGSVVVGSSENSMYSGQAFRWTKVDGLVGLGSFDENIFGGRANGVSADGTVVVGELHTSRYYAPISPFRWTQETGIVDLAHIFPNQYPYPYSRAYGVSGDGYTIVGTSINFGSVENNGFSGHKAFRWTESSGVDTLGDGEPQQANAVSADGSIVVGVNENEAFRWTQQTGMVSLGYLGLRSAANAVLADGSVVVGNHGGRAFRWTQGTGGIGLGDVEYIGGGDAKGVSADGSIIVGVGSDWGMAFHWTQKTGMVSLKETLIGAGLDVSGWTLSSANAISADGFTIVGNGTNPSGQSEAWVANLSPEPIPEPLTILGSIAAIAFAAGFERKFNKNKFDQKDPDA